MRVLRKKGNNPRKVVHRMGETRVRLQYSGFIMFLSSLISVGTGLLFVLMITRNITAEEFGIFGNMNDTLGYFTLPATIIPFWTVRFIARRHAGSSRTGLTGNLILSLLSAMFYLALLSTIMSAFHITEVYRTVYAILAVQIVESYMTSGFQAILQARKPQMIGFSVLIFELCKVAAGFTFIIGLRLQLLGAIISIILAHMIRLLFYLKLTLSDLHEKVKWSYIKEWLKASPINIYNIVGQRLAYLILILLFIYGGELARAYYGAASTIANIVGYSALLAFALYPRLLSRSNPQDVTTSLRMVSMFAIPMTFGSVILSNSYLTILNPIYRAARTAVILLATSSACLSFSSVFNSVVTGTERFDAEARIHFKELISSRLFLIFSLPYVQAAFTIPTTYLALIYVVKDAAESAIFLAALNLGASVTTMLVGYTLARRSIDLRIPWASVARYLAASIVMAAVLYVFPAPTRLSTTLGLTMLGGIVYFLILLVIDEESRIIAKSAKREILIALRFKGSEGADKG